MKLLVIGTMVLSLSGCATLNSVTGCASAEQQLSTARTALAAAQLLLSNAEAAGASGSIITGFQGGISLINTDIASIQTLVTQTCAAAPPVTVKAMAIPVITLAQARKLAKADADLVNAMKERD